jgi:glycine cleavage system H lipoate-binding protein
METGGRVLVVDDEEVVCKSVKRILERKKLVVDSALSASEALKKMSQEEYSVVITDLMMPKISGMQLLKEVKTQRPEVAVIMITGYATIRTAVQAIKLGAFDYIPKPFTPKAPPEGVAGKEAEISVVRYEEEEAREEAPPLEGDLYCMPEHSWARVESDGTVRVGMEEMFCRTAGEIVNIDLPYEGDEVHQGDVCVRVTSSGLHIHKLWSPITGKVVQVNEILNKDCLLAMQEPRGKGWLIRVKPASLKEDLENLVFVKSGAMEGR